MLRKSRRGFAITSIGVLLLFSTSIAMATTPATEISIGPPGAITTDSLGNVFFSSPNLVLKLDTHGNLARVAGNVTAGYSGDGGPATQALLSFPASYPEMVQDPIDFSPLIAGLAVDTFGNLYIADAYNNQVRKVDTQGVITTVAAPSPLFSPDAKWPLGVATDAAGNLYVSYAYGALLKRTAGGVNSNLAARQCQIGSPESGLCGPEAIAVDARGNVYVPDGFCRVRKVGTDGSVITVAGEDGIPGAGFAFICGFSGDGGPATHAALVQSALRHCGDPAATCTSPTLITTASAKSTLPASLQPLPEIPSLGLFRRRRTCCRCRIEFPAWRGVRRHGQHVYR